MLEHPNSHHRKPTRVSSPAINTQVVIRGSLIFAIYLLIFIFFDSRAYQVQVFPGIVAWYPPDGLSFALLLTLGARYFPWLAITSFISSLFIFQFSRPLPALIGWAILISLTYGLAAWFLRQRIKIDTQLSSPRDLFWMITTAAAGSTALAVISVSSAIASGDVPPPDRLWATVQWWIGEMIGVLIVAPALLIHVMPHVKRFLDGEALIPKTPRFLARGSFWIIMQGLGIIAAIYLAVDVNWPNDFHPFFLVAIPMVWIALKHGLPGASIGNLLINFGMTWAMQGYHHFNLTELGQLQLIMLVITMTSLLIGIMVSEQMRSLKSQGTDVERQGNKIIYEVIMVSILAMMAWVLEYTFDFYEAISEWETRYQIKGIDETFVTLLVLGVASAIFSYRRWREVQAEIRERKRAQAELQALYSDLEIRVQERTADLLKTNERLQSEVTERRHAEMALRTAEAKYRTLVEQLPAVTYIVEYGQITNPVYVSPQIESMLGFTAEEWLADPDLWSNQLHPEDRDRVLAEFDLRDKLNQPIDLDYRIRTRTGHVRWIHDQSVLIVDETGARFGHGLIFDITERKNVEESLAQSERRFRELIENSSDAITLLDAHGVAVYDSPAAPGMLGYEPNELIGRNVFELLHPDDFSALQPVFERLTKTPGARSNNIFRIRHKDGSWRWIESVVTNLLAEPSVGALVANYQDITERRHAEEKIQSRTEELATLYELSRALAGASVLGDVLDLVNRRTVESMHATFSRIMLLEGDEFVVRSAYPIRVLDHELLIGKQRPIGAMPYCERILQQEEPVILHTDHPEVTGEERAALLLDFAQTLCLIPLRVFDFTSNSTHNLGLLMVGEERSEEREPFTPEKLRLARSISDQAAIAIENARLFNDLERSNIELSLAYDATITGWSAALDLRDKETEGHTQRVTEMTLRLAAQMGFSGQELVHVRRGALLHDIGKMGVPDRILHKPDKLTDEEWVRMRLHPTYAHDMLKPITYLGPALDIPYCHHEKWDGTGYPRQLKGEDIPIAARIFAVVDVYDALTSDRPYRNAWSQERTLEHIRQLSGAHFDPDMVNAFLTLMEEELG